MLWLKRIFYGIAGLLLAGWLARTLRAKPG